jgi:hypothetical protein
MAPVIAVAPAAVVCPAAAQAAVIAVAPAAVINPAQAAVVQPAALHQPAPPGPVAQIIAATPAAAPAMHQFTVPELEAATIVLQQAAANRTQPQQMEPPTAASTPTGRSHHTRSRSENSILFPRTVMFNDTNDSSAPRPQSQYNNSANTSMSSIDHTNSILKQVARNIPYFEGAEAQFDKWFEAIWRVAQLADYDSDIVNMYIGQSTSRSVQTMIYSTNPQNWEELRSHLQKMFSSTPTAMVAASQLRHTLQGSIIATF